MTAEHGDISKVGTPDTYTVESALILTGVSTARLARYERAQIVTPVHVGRHRFYHEGDLRRVRKAYRLERDLGINLPGVEVILRLTEELNELQRRMSEYEAQTRAGPRHR
jgi:MerR family transcriptional regulator, heat shock protein HspR